MQPFPHACRPTWMIQWSLRVIPRSRHNKCKSPQLRHCFSEWLCTFEMTLKGNQKGNHHFWWSPYDKCSLILRL